MKIKWPCPDALLAYSPDAPLPARLALLAGPRTDELIAAVGGQDPIVLELIVSDLADYFGCSRARRLLHLVDRYGTAIAADLADLYGIDMLDVFRGARVPDELMERVDNLPRHSRLSEALAQDDELARLMAVDDDDETPTGPEVRFTEWTPETERLATIADLLGSILSALGSLAGAKVNVPPEPRPSGANKRLKAQQDENEYQDVLADVEAAKARHLEQNHTTEEG